MLSVVTSAAIVAVLALPAVAADMTIKGDVVDLACATDQKLASQYADVIACSIAVAKKGGPLVVKTADALYTITGDYAANKNAKLLDFLTKKVIATGEVLEKDGVRTINVKSIKLAS
jgi:hypothetical protein